MSYQHAHERTRRVRGSASNYICPCGKNAQEWAYQGSARERVDANGRRYSDNPDDYLAMCKLCHRRLDASAITECPRQHPYTPENTLVRKTGRRECKTCKYERNNRRRHEHPPTPEQHARRLEWQRQWRAKKRAA